MPMTPLRWASQELTKEATVRSSQGRRGLILLGLRMTPFLWASQEPTNVVAVSQFAAPRDVEPSFWFAHDTIPLGLPGRSLQGRRGLMLVCV